ncbi:MULTISPECIES: hypothetical protein [Paenibacillus]|uniref:hypothetical protein n=1 Tax=Paenibacillus TaxID=44249 RepID=UPI0009558B23|nr:MULTISPECIES: hypothetical protein [Paenibacillus]ASS68691.1 MFS transporter [Paenibacillus sp. RUD330]SIR55895.1 hypothetical protein SAMN05880555_4207 [Paenibacillus sp. RU4X]SIR64396.1 hypothetical protein SAMN05880570_4209 [Paenibacillus sp. RU4T]
MENESASRRAAQGEAGLAERDASSADDGNAGKLVRLLCVILLFSVTNVTMFNMALPEISRAFALLPSEAGWVVTGYSIVYAVSGTSTARIGLILFPAAMSAALLGRYGGRMAERKGSLPVIVSALLLGQRCGRSRNRQPDQPDGLAGS